MILFIIIGSLSMFVYIGFYEDHIAGCDIGEDTFRGEEEGNCPGWVYEYLEEDRDNKISYILK